MVCSLAACRCRGVGLRVVVDDDDATVLRGVALAEATQHVERIVCKSLGFGKQVRLLIVLRPEALVQVITRVRKAALSGHSEFRSRNIQFRLVELCHMRVDEASQGESSVA